MSADKLKAFIQQTTLEQMKREAEAAVGKILPETGQPALEGQVVKGEDVRVLETMRTSVYDPDRTGVVNEAALLEGNSAADLLDRANHTGTQPTSTIDNFNSEVQALQTWKYVVKDTDETKNSTTTLANDTVLVKTIQGGEVWRMQLRVLLTAANDTMDYKFALNYSGSTNAVYCKARYVAAGGTTETILSQSSLIGSTSVTAATSGFAYVDIDILLDANTGGTFGFQWAQDSSDAGNLTVLKGSYLASTLAALPPL